MLETVEATDDYWRGYDDGYVQAWDRAIEKIDTLIANCIGHGGPGCPCTGAEIAKAVLEDSRPQMED